MSVGVRVAEGWCHAVKFVVGRIWDEADAAAVCMDRWRKSEEDGAWRFPSVVLVTLLLLANEYNIYYLVFTRRAGISNVGFVCFFHSSATTKDSQSHVYHRTPCCSVLATIFPFCLFCLLFYLVQSISTTKYSLQPHAISAVNTARCSHCTSVHAV